MSFRETCELQSQDVEARGEHTYGLGGVGGGVRTRT
jgi:hypothetical protein